MQVKSRFLRVTNQSVRLTGWEIHLPSCGFLVLMLVLPGAPYALSSQPACFARFSFSFCPVRECADVHGTLPATDELPERGDHHADRYCIRAEWCGPAAEHSGVCAERAGRYIYGRGELPVVGTPPSGSPLVGTTTNFDGTFTIPNMPVGTNIPLVIQTGRWRRQVLIPTVQACTGNVLTTDLSRFPRNHNEGDIPFIAVATGSADSVECVLRKVGIDNAEFTDPNGGGRINFYTATGRPGATIDAATPTADALLSTQAALNQYDVLMLPCEGGEFIKPAQQLANVVNFANAGGRIYSSHFSYVWMFQNPPFNTIATWHPNERVTIPDGIATVDQTFSEGKTLAEWLQLVGASTTAGQIPIQTLRQDQDGVVSPTQSYLRLNNAADGNPVMQFVFDTPVGQTGGQCGRVLFNEYHVEAPGQVGAAFPAECSAAATMTAQEKLLEFSLFELSSDGSAATLTPATQDFGTEAVGFNSPTETFTWTNHSTFSAAVSLLTATGDFTVTSSNCASVAAGASCQINVVFNPTAVGARTGMLTVGSSGTTLISTLTGTGIPALTFSLGGVNFGSLDVGAVKTQTFTVTNGASGTVPVPPFTTTGDYGVSSNCGGALGAGATCTVTVSFQPTTTGARPGTVTLASTSAAYPAVPTMLTGNGIDFTLGLSPTTGSAVAGYGVTTNSTTTPLAGFANGIVMTCSTTAPGTTCTLNQNNFSPAAAVQDLVTITTTSKYTVVGYGGAGGGWLWVLAVGSGCLLWVRRRSMGSALRGGLVLVILAAAGLSVTGCSGKQPGQNAIYTGPGTYSFTVKATDGFLVHSATYSLTVSAK